MSSSLDANKFKEMLDSMTDEEFLAEIDKINNEYSAHDIGPDALEYIDYVKKRNSIECNLNKKLNYYEENIEPDADVIFVFGSNPEGRHGAGAAKVAHNKFNAQYGIGEGLTGNAYAVPTKDLRIKTRIPADDIICSITKMYDTAIRMPEKRFMVAYRNKFNERSLCGYSGSELVAMYLSAGDIPNNVYFSSEWKDIINKLKSNL